MPVTVAYAVVGHHARQTQAETLAGLLDAHLCLDDGTTGTPANHDKAWHAAHTTALRTGAPWCAVLEDDAQPIDGFTHHAAEALAHIPSDGACSFYVGTTRPNAKLVTRAITKANNTGAAWLTSPTTLWGVAIALPTHHIPHMLTHVATVHMPYDQRLGTWLRHTRMPCHYTNPSLVDHADTPSLVGNHHPPRNAHHTGTPTTWDTHTVEM